MIMKKILQVILICFIAINGHSENIAPPVPENTNAGNGNSMLTELKIDVKDNIDAITIKQTSAHAKLITKSYKLHEADPTVIRTILTGIIRGTKTKSQVPDTRVESVRYKGQEFTGVLIVTAAADRFQPSKDGSMSIPELVKLLDEPLMLDLQAQVHFQEYQAKYKPANELKELLERFVLNTAPMATIITANPKDIAAAGGPIQYLAAKKKDGEVDTKFGTDFVMLDEELNKLLIASSPAKATEVRTFLEHQDQPYENLHVKMTIYEVANKNGLELGNDFNAWKNANATSFVNISDNGHNVMLKAELDAKYFDFLARKGKAKIYSSMDMLLKPDEKSIFDQRKIFATTLPKTVTIPSDPTGGTTAPGQVPTKTETTAPYSYGTYLSITPYKQGDYAKLVINIDNISLVGFNDNGTAKTANSKLNTEIVVDNKGTQYVAGYLSRKEVVKSVSKVPFLGSIPLLGYLFSSEADHTKTNQLVVVVSCVEQKYDETTIDAGNKEIPNIKAITTGSNDDPKPGYDQMKLNL